MRNRLRTFILSAAFAIAAVSQASAAWDADYLPNPVDQIVQASVEESITVEAAPNGVNSPVAATEPEASNSTDLAVVDVSVPLPEDISIQVVAEMVALAPVITGDAPATSAETVAIEIEVTGSLATSMPPQEEASEAVKVSTAVATE
jgi:hypothetical protein